MEHENNLGFKHVVERVAITDFDVMLIEQTLMKLLTYRRKIANLLLDENREGDATYDELKKEFHIVNNQIKHVLSIV